MWYTNRVTTGVTQSRSRLMARFILDFLSESNHTDACGSGFNVEEDNLRKKEEVRAL